MRSISELKKCIHKVKNDTNYRITDDECDEILAVLDAAELISNQLEERKTEIYGNVCVSDQL